MGKCAQNAWMFLVLVKGVMFKQSSFSQCSKTAASSGFSCLCTSWETLCYMATPPAELLALEGSKSAVWSYFGFPAQDGLTGFFLGGGRGGGIRPP